MNKSFINEFVSDVIELTDGKKLKWKPVEKTADNYKTTISCLQDGEKAEISMTIGCASNPTKRVFLMVEHGKFSTSVPNKPINQFYLTSLCDGMEINNMLLRLFDIVYANHVSSFIEKKDKEFIIGAIKQIKTSKN